jgi:hypothetical protein
VIEGKSRQESGIPVAEISRQKTGHPVDFGDNNQSSIPPAAQLESRGTGDSSLEKVAATNSVCVALTSPSTTVGGDRPNNTAQGPVEEITVGHVKVPWMDPAQEPAEETTVGYVEVPLMVRVAWQPSMEGYLTPPDGVKELTFSVKDNIGLGDCFYHSICQSSAFKSKYHLPRSTQN